MTAPWPVLIASPDIENCRHIANTLERWGFDPVWASTVQQAREVLSSRSVPLVFCEDRLGDGDFRDVIHAARLAPSKVRVVVTSRQRGRRQHRESVEAIRIGAFEVIACPCYPTDLDWAVVHALRDAAQETTAA